MKKYALWALPFLLGLGIAWGVVQLGGNGSSSPATETVAVDDAGSLTEPNEPQRASNEPEQESEESPELDLDLEDDSNSGSESASEDDPSPLASIVEPLGSALPEIALQGVGEPIGFEPISMAIPDLDVSTAPIEPVGIEPNGELEVPGAESIGWYQFGAGIGGGRGSTVLAGHIAYNGVDGVFRDLDQMQPGQVFTVDHDGSTLFYEVTEVVQYTKEDLPIDDLFREDGPERLVLITCGGPFNPSLRSYDDNVVVIAVPVTV